MPQLDLVTFTQYQLLYFLFFYIYWVLDFWLIPIMSSKFKLRFFLYDELATKTKYLLICLKSQYFLILSLYKKITDFEQISNNLYINYYNNNNLYIFFENIKFKHFIFFDFDIVNQYNFLNINLIFNINLAEKLNTSTYFWKNYLNFINLYKLFDNNYLNIRLINFFFSDFNKLINIKNNNKFFIYLYLLNYSYKQHLFNLLAFTSNSNNKIKLISIKLLTLNGFFESESIDFGKILFFNEANKLILISNKYRQFNIIESYRFFNFISFFKINFILKSMLVKFHQFLRNISFDNSLYKLINTLLNKILLPFLGSNVYIKNNFFKYFFIPFFILYAFSKEIFIYDEEFIIIVSFILVFTLFNFLIFNKINDKTYISKIQSIFFSDNFKYYKIYNKISNYLLVIKFSLLKTFFKKKNIFFFKRMYNLTLL